jgi:RNA polymerase sigma factor (TIGR02999 family)
MPVATETLVSALPALDPATYAHLHALATRIFRERGGADDTLQPTALLNEAWMKLARHDARYESRRHFIAVAATAMRHIMVDRARARVAEKRGGDARRTTLTGLPGEEDAHLDVLAVDEILRELEENDPTAARVVVLRTFGGLTIDETAEAVEMSRRSVRRTWDFARAFLAHRLRA